LIHRYREQARFHRGFLVNTHFANTPEKIVGASLLAMMVCQSTSMSLIHRYREQARSHRGFLVNTHFANTPEKIVGASLLAMTVCQ